MKSHLDQGDITGDWQWKSSWLFLTSYWDLFEGISIRKVPSFKIHSKPWKKTWNEGDITRKSEKNPLKTMRNPSTSRRYHYKMPFKNSVSILTLPFFHRAAPRLQLWAVAWNALDQLLTGGLCHVESFHGPGRLCFNRSTVTGERNWGHHGITGGYPSFFGAIIIGISWKITSITMNLKGFHEIFHGTSWNLNWNRSYR